MDKGSENYMNEEQLLSEIKKLEGVYLQPQTFKQYKNYWLPEKIVKESKNVLSLGVHRDVGWEQSMLKDNSNMNIHCYDPTPDTVKMWETDFEGKNNMTFHQMINLAFRFYFAEAGQVKEIELFFLLANYIFLHTEVIY